MVNLVPAKCPNCGGQLELDDNMKKTECKYCKSTIIVDEAIEKYQIEISGKVEVDGIKSDKKRFEDAEKHFKIEEYKEAFKIYEELIKNDNFNIQAQCGWIKTVIKFYKLDEKQLNELEPRERNKDLWNYISEIYKKYNNFKKLGDEKESSKYLKDYEDIIEYLVSQYEKLLSDEEKCDKLTEKLISEIPPKQDRDYYEGRFWLLDQLFQFTTPYQNFSYYLWDSTNKSYDKDEYYPKSIQFLRDGSLYIVYKNLSRLPVQPQIINKIFKSPNASNIDELEKIVDEFMERCKTGNFKFKQEKKGLFSKLKDKISK